MLDNLTQIHERDQQDTLGEAERSLKRLTKSQDPSQNSQLASANTSDSEPDYTLICIIAAPDALIIAELALLAVPSKLPVVFVAESTQPSYPDQVVLTVKLPLTAETDCRLSVFDELQAIITLMQRCGVLQDNNFDVRQLTGAAASVLQAAQQWQAIVATVKNPAKQLARELLGRSIIVQTSSQLLPLANWWSTLLGYNARQLAWPVALDVRGSSQLAAWSKQPPNTAYAVIDMQSSSDLPVIAQSAKAMTKVLSGLRPEPVTIELQGTTYMEQIVWGIHFAQYVSNYLALANGINPTPIKIQESYNKAMENL